MWTVCIESLSYELFSNWWMNGWKCHSWISVPNLLENSASTVWFSMTENRGQASCVSFSRFPLATESPIANTVQALDYSGCDVIILLGQRCKSMFATTNYILKKQGLCIPLAFVQNLTLSRHKRVDQGVLQNSVPCWESLV